MEILGAAQAQTPEGIVHKQVKVVMIQVTVVMRMLHVMVGLVQVGQHQHRLQVDHVQKHILKIKGNVQQTLLHVQKINSVVLQALVAAQPSVQIIVFVRYFQRVEFVLALSKWMKMGVVLFLKMRKTDRLEISYLPNVVKIHPRIV